MNKKEIRKPHFGQFNFSKNLTIHYQLDIPQLMEMALLRGEGKLANNGALAVDTGTFTGRSPKDRFIVEDNETKEHIWWGDINIVGLALAAKARGHKVIAVNDFIELGYGIFKIFLLIIYF